jgi:hypothetical protein
MAATMLLSPHEPIGRFDSGINGRRGDCAVAGTDCARRRRIMIRTDALSTACIMFVVVASGFLQRGKK